MSKIAKFNVGLFLASLFSVLLMGGCSRIVNSHNREYQTINDSGLRNTILARQKNNQAISAMENQNFALAETLLNEALIADVDFGPAHNTLGRLYYKSKKYYLAAWEFEYAARLMPERVEPINNLGLVFEAVGQFESAIAYYQQAVTLAPDTAQFLGNLIRASLANGAKPFDVKDEINHLILIDDRDEWVNWAKLKLLSDDTEVKLLRKMTDNNTSNPKSRDRLEEILPIESSVLQGNSHSYESRSDLSLPPIVTPATENLNLD